MAALCGGRWVRRENERKPEDGNDGLQEVGLIYRSSCEANLADGEVGHLLTLRAGKRGDWHVAAHWSNCWVPAVQDPLSMAVVIVTKTCWDIAAASLLRFVPVLPTRQKASTRLVKK